MPLIHEGANPFSTITLPFGKTQNRLHVDVENPIFRVREMSMRWWFVLSTMLLVRLVAVSDQLSDDERLFFVDFYRQDLKARENPTWDDDVAVFFYDLDGDGRDEALAATRDSMKNIHDVEWEKYIKCPNSYDVVMPDKIGCMWHIYRHVEGRWQRYSIEFRYSGENATPDFEGLPDVTFNGFFVKDYSGGYKAFLAVRESSTRVYNDVKCAAWTFTCDRDGEQPFISLSYDYEWKSIFEKGWNRLERLPATKSIYFSSKWPNERFSSRLEPWIEHWSKDAPSYRMLPLDGIGFPKQIEVKSLNHSYIREYDLNDDGQIEYISNMYHTHDYVFVKSSNGVWFASDPIYDLLSPTRFGEKLNGFYQISSQDQASDGTYQFFETQAFDGEAYRVRRHEQTNYRTLCSERDGCLVNDVNQFSAIASRLERAIRQAEPFPSLPDAGTVTEYVPGASFVIHGATNLPPRFQYTITLSSTTMPSAKVQIKDTPFCIAEEYPPDMPPKLKQRLMEAVRQLLTREADSLDAIAKPFFAAATKIIQPMQTMMQDQAHVTFPKKDEIIHARIADYLPDQKLRVEYERFNYSTFSLTLQTAEPAVETPGVRSTRLPNTSMYAILQLPTSGRPPSDAIIEGLEKLLNFDFQKELAND